MPAKAGIQVLNLLLKIKLKDWIPAFAGMTKLLKIPFVNKHFMKQAYILLIAYTMEAILN